MVQGAEESRPYRWPTTLIARRLRIGSGLILFAFVTAHLVNHALGLVSLDWMEAMRSVRTGITRSWPGTGILAAAALVHMILGITKFLARRVWRAPWGEIAQLATGLLIPLLLARHIIGTRVAHSLYGIDDDYTYALFVMWPAEAWRQTALIFLVWIHGTLGLHFWLRIEPWYQKAQVWLAMIAGLVPVLAIAGFAVAARQLQLTETFESPFESREQIRNIYAIMDAALWAYAGLLAVLVGWRLFRDGLIRLRPGLRITFAGGPTINATAGPTLLEISRAHAVPLASICGGRARCSTCRVRVMAGQDAADPSQETERRVLARIGAGDAVRLACQLRPRADMTVAPLLPSGPAAFGDLVRHDKYHRGVERTVTLMFTDIRGFTRLTERQMAYDTVFLLNLYLTQMAAVVTDKAGYVDKFMGDGLMAIFGMDTTPEDGARNAIAAAREMSGVLVALNQSLANQISESLQIGIGLHSGSAVLGRIGIAPNHEAGNRISALGDTVNTASRVEQACKDLSAQLVLTEATRLLAGLALDPDHRHDIILRGKDAPVTVYAYRNALDMPNVEHSSAPRAVPLPA